MPYQTIRNLVETYGIDAWFKIVECKNKHWTDEQIARTIHKSSGKNLSRRRVSQIIETCIEVVFLPNEVAQSYLDNSVLSDQGTLEFRKKRIEQLRTQSEETRHEMLRYIPGRSTSAKSNKES